MLCTFVIREEDGMAVVGNCDHCPSSDTYHHCCLCLDESLQIGWGEESVGVRSGRKKVEQREGKDWGQGEKERVVLVEAGREEEGV